MLAPKQDGPEDWEIISAKLKGHYSDVDIRIKKE